MDKICFHCGELIAFDDYFDEWQHVYSSDPNCKKDNGEYLYTYAIPRVEKND